MCRPNLAPEVVFQTEWWKMTHARHKTWKTHPFSIITCIILLEFHKNRFGWVLIPDCATLSIKYKFVKPPGWYSIYFGWGCAAGFAKVLPFTKPNFANFVTPYQTKNAHLFLISIFCEQSC